MLVNLKKYLGINIFKFKKYQKRNVFDEINTMFSLLAEDTIRIELGEDVCLFIEKIKAVTKEERERINNKSGFILPPVRFLENKSLQENEINVILNGKKTEERFVIPKEENIHEEIVNIINELYERHLSEIFSNELVEKYIDRARVNNYKTVAEVCYRLAAVEIKYILIDLLTHNKSINNISYIFEKISEKIYIYGSYNDNIEKFSHILVTSL